MLFVLRVEDDHEHNQSVVLPMVMSWLARDLASNKSRHNKSNIASPKRFFYVGWYFWVSPAPYFFLHGVQKKNNIFHGSSGQATRKYLNQSFDLSQIDSQSNWSDCRLKSKLMLTYLHELWSRALMKKNHFHFLIVKHIFCLHGGSELFKKMKKILGPRNKFYTWRLRAFVNKNKH